MFDAGGCAASFGKHRTVLLPLLLGRGATVPLVNGAEAVRSFEICQFAVRAGHTSCHLVVHAWCRVVVILNTIEQVTVGLLAATNTVNTNASPLLEEECRVGCCSKVL